MDRFLNLAMRSQLVIYFFKENDIVFKWIFIIRVLCYDSNRGKSTSLFTNKLFNTLYITEDRSNIPCRMQQNIIDRHRVIDVFARFTTDISKWFTSIQETYTGSEMAILGYKHMPARTLRKSWSWYSNAFKLASKEVMLVDKEKRLDCSSLVTQ